MTLHDTHLSNANDATLSVQPRARGRIVVSSKSRGDRAVLDQLRQSGSAKCLFPRASNTALDAVILNTAGGVTGGDEFDVSATAGANTTLSLTTQACERAYRAQPGETGQLRNHLRVEPGARMHWLPQETILFDGSALDRQLRIDMAADGALLMVEPLVFGRAAMGEALTNIRLRDRIEIRRDSALIYLDALRFDGDASARLRQPFVANGAGAMASLVYVAPDAEAQYAALHPMLPQCGGASLLRDDMLVLRLLADDSFALRQTLVPVLNRLSGDTLPRCWMI